MRQGALGPGRRLLRQIHLFSSIQLCPSIFLVTCQVEQNRPSVYFTHSRWARYNSTHVTIPVNHKFASFDLNTQIYELRIGMIRRTSGDRPSNIVAQQSSVLRITTIKLTAFMVKSR